MSEYNNRMNPYFRPASPMETVSDDENVVLDLFSLAGEGRPSEDGPPLDLLMLKTFVQDQAGRNHSPHSQRQLSETDAQTIRRNIIHFRNWSSAHANLLSALLRSDAGTQ